MTDMINAAGGFRKYSPPRANGAITMESIPAIIRLFASAGVGAIVFAASEVAVWRLAGSPDGVERSSVNWIRARMSKLFPRPSAPAG